jgi:hypothetical protein
VLFDRLSRRGNQACPAGDQGGGGVAAVVDPGLEVVRGCDDLEPRALGLDREVEQGGGVELLGGGLVADADGHGGPSYGEAGCGSG